VFEYSKPEKLEFEKIKKHVPTDKRLPKEVRNAGFKIVPFKTNKAKIKLRKIMEDGVIPHHPASVIINGHSGSGKSQLLVNLLSRPEFYGKRKDEAKKGKPSHYFDQIYMFSPTAGEQDDLCQHLQTYCDLKKSDIHNEFDQELLLGILDKQAKEINEKGIHKSRKVLLILDDIQSDKKFLRSKAIKRLFLMNRHFNTSTYLCGQSFNLTPRSCRLQANNIFIFPMGGSERKILIDEFTPPGLNKKEFGELVDYATHEQYNFLHINRKKPPRERFRKNLDQIIWLEK
jgi:hypothetical protein